jgi:hypothetical protein
MKAHGNPDNLQNKEYQQIKMEGIIERLSQPKPVKHRQKSVGKAKVTLCKGKIYLSEYNGLFNPAKFDNFDGNKYKKGS